MSTTHLPIQFPCTIFNRQPFEMYFLARFLLPVGNPQWEHLELKLLRWGVVMLLEIVELVTVAHRA